MGGEEQAADAVPRMRAGVRATFLRLGAGVRQVSPGTLLALLSAGALAPVLAVVGGVTGAGAVAAIGLLGNVGANVLTDLITGAIDRLRRTDAAAELGQDDIERELMPRIEAALAAGNASSETLRAEIAEVFRQIGLSQTALELAIHSDNQELQDAVMASLADLSSEFVEFGFLLTDVRSIALAILDTVQRQDARYESDRALAREQSAQLRALIDQVATVERRTRYIYGADVFASTSHETAHAVKFENRYRQGMRQSLDRVELFGLELLSAPRSYRLGTAYVSLMLERTGVSNVPSTPLQMEQLLGRSQRLLVEGAAGTGKSTLLQYLALRVMDGQLPGLINGHSSLMPFLIKLRNFATGDNLKLPRDPGELVRSVAPLLGQDEPTGWASGLLGGGRALILMDGIDEVREVHRSAVLAWLKEFVLWYPESFYVITSRPAAVREQWRDDLRALGFGTARLEPMTEVQVDDFVDRWYYAAAEADGYWPQPNEAKSLASKLKKELASRQDLTSLVSTPLLCAVICAVSLDRRRLPERRTELYNMALDLLLERRDVQRSIRGSLQLSRSVSRSMLGRIALWMLISGGDTIPHQAALTTIAELAGHFGESADYLLQQLLEQTGLVQETPYEAVEFRYPSFQDYLAAGEIVRQDLVQHLIINCENSRYHDVIVDAVGLADGETQQRLMNELITRAERAEAQAGQAQALWLLVRDCLNEASMVGQLVDRIERGLRGAGVQANGGWFPTPRS